jgi:hypothetical protein
MIEKVLPKANTLHTLKLLWLEEKNVLTAKATVKIRCFVQNIFR